MNIFKTDNYRKVVSDLIKSRPKKGYGQAKKLAEALGVSTTLVSQVLNEEKHITPEQALGVAHFFSLSEHETQFFTTLVNFERAGSSDLKKWLKKDLDKMRLESQKVASQIAFQKKLSDEERGIFYSDWCYSAIRMLTSIPQHHSVESISEHLGLQKAKVAEALHFLTSAGLVLENNGFKIGPQSTHLNPDSPWAKLHHANWRSKALEFSDYPEENKLHYTSPMTLSRKDAEIVRSKILNLISEINKIVDPSPPEDLMCLNMDWFKFHSRKHNS